MGGLTNSVLIYVGLGAVFAIVFIAGLVVLGGLRTKGRLQRALNMTLFLVRLPREAPSKDGDNRSAKELIAVSEQMLAGFSNFHSAGWNKFLYGEPYLALEIAVHHVGEETHFYFAVPRQNEDLIRKQIYGYFPKASVAQVKDYNIFNPEGAAAGSYVTYTENPLLPVLTYNKLPSDPLEGILTSMSQLQDEGEGAAVQILIHPAHYAEKKALVSSVVKEMQKGHSFKEALQRAKHPSDKNKPVSLFDELTSSITGREAAPAKNAAEQAEKEMPRSPTPADEEVIKALMSKNGKQNFDVNMRFITSALSRARADMLLENLHGALVQFSSPDLNSFKAVKLTGGSLRKLIYNYSFRLFNDQQSIPLSVEEVASLYHMPLATSGAPKVNFLRAKTAEPPPNLPASGIIVGRNDFRGRETLVRMSDEDRRRHLYMLGQTGTGKTTLLKAMVRQDIENGRGICVIDPHGDLAEFALSVVPKERTENVIYFDPADLERPMGLNMLEIDPSHPEQKTMVINELFGIIDKLYDLKTTGGPMFEKYFKNALLLLLDDYGNYVPTLSDLTRVLVDAKFRAEKLSRETNPLVKEFWQLEAEKAGGEASLANMAPYISSKVDTFVSNEFLRPIINQKKSAFNFREIMDDKKILIVNLSKGRIGDLNANLLGMIIVGKLLMAALSRVDIGEKERSDFYLYIDEFQNFTTDSISVILSEARKYRLDMVLAHQFIKQLKENIRDAVFGNVGSVMAFRISVDDAEFLKNKFEPEFSAQDLANIENLNAYARILINGQPSPPFNVAVQTEKVFGAGAPETVRAVKEISRLKFGRPREEVEEEIRRRY